MVLLKWGLCLGVCVCLGIWGVVFRFVCCYLVMCKWLYLGVYVNTYMIRDLRVFFCAGS